MSEKEISCNINNDGRPNRSEKRSRELRVALDGQNVLYVILSLGGFGWSRGTNSIIEILEGTHKGKQYIANLGGGAQIMKEVVK